MRIEGWEGRLARYFNEAANTPFAWGSHDCALFAAEWVRICTGRDHAAAWRGAYRTEKGAKIRMTRLGFSGVAAVASAFLSEIPVPRAKRGDLVLHPQGALGVCNGLFSHFVTEAGLCVQETLACPRAWEVN